MVHGHLDVRAVLAAAIRAPSAQNSQPWAFRVDGRTVELLADRTRALPVNDPLDRELTISCGAALVTLRIAAEAAGDSAGVVVLPDPADVDLLARVELAPDGGSATEEARALAGAIERRRTVRGRLAARALPEGLVDRLVQAAAAEGARLVPVEGADVRHDLAELVAEADAIQFSDPRWRRELAAWTHPRRRHDGLPPIGLDRPDTRLDAQLFEPHEGPAERDHSLVLDAPLLVVLGTDSDEVADWIAAGQALQRVLLTAAAEGVQAGHLNQPCQVERLRSGLGYLAGGGASPQMVLRFGYPAGTAFDTPRRPLEDVLEER